MGCGVTRHPRTVAVEELQVPVREPLYNDEGTDEVTTIDRATH
jgi:hypothetical protein